jgi:hypothetical protein
MKHADPCDCHMECGCTVRGERCNAPAPAGEGRDEPPGPADPGSLRVPPSAPVDAGNAGDPEGLTVRSQTMARHRTGLPDAISWPPDGNLVTVREGETEPGTLGYFDRDAQEIVIRPDQPKAGKHIVLLHEMLHAAIHYRFGDDKGEPMDEENLVEAISLPLLGMLVSAGLWRGVTARELNRFQKGLPKAPGPNGRVRPDPEPVAPLDYETLDPGIRETVRLLRKWGFQTTDSGDGVSKAGTEAEACMEYQPNVRCRVPPEALAGETRRLCHMLAGAGIRLGPKLEDLREFCAVPDDAEDADGVLVEGHFLGYCDEAFIDVTGLDDALLLARRAQEAPSGSEG